MCFSCATDIILSQASHYVKHFLIIISAGKGDAPKVGRYLIFMTLSLRVGCKRFKRTFYLQQLKSQIGLLYLSEGVFLAFSNLLFLLRNLDFHAELFLLFIIHRIRSICKQAGSIFYFRECNNVSNSIFLSHKHYKAVKTICKPCVWWYTVFERF